MNKVVEFLKANPVQYLATVGRDGYDRSGRASADPRDRYDAP